MSASSGGMSDDDVKEAASAMKEAADEKGVDYMTSPLGDIVAALTRAAEIVETKEDPL